MNNDVDPSPATSSSSQPSGSSSTLSAGVSTPQQQNPTYNGYYGLPANFSTYGQANNPGVLQSGAQYLQVQYLTSQQLLSQQFPAVNYAYYPNAAAQSQSTNAHQGRGKSPAIPRSTQPSSVIAPTTPTTQTPAFEKTYQHWDTVLGSFLRVLGFNQALEGFKQDVIAMNAEWERNNVPPALTQLSRNLEHLSKGKAVDTRTPPDISISPEPSLDVRKTAYFTLPNGSKPPAPSSITKSISRFLAQQRANNNASNRSEFLISLAEKRKRIEDAESSAINSDEVPHKRPKTEGEVDELNGQSIEVTSCARTDAKFVDRASQIKYDIARNEEGPLSRTVKASNNDVPSLQKSENVTESVNTVEEQGDKTLPTRHPGLTERLNNVEDHLAVKYVPCPPKTLLIRLKMLEDHIVKLEKEYPPWAALHFNQPRRGWPPPPRPTPIIVPVHQREVLPSSSTKNTSLPGTKPGTSNSTAGLTSTKSSSPVDPAIPAHAGGPRDSSLRRAVLQKLEVQKAMSDLNGT